MDFEIFSMVSEIGFPTFVAVCLLWFIFKKMDGYRKEQVEVKIGLHLILAKLGALDEYEKKLNEFNRVRKE